MIIIGCDYHPGVQQIAFVDTESGEFQEARLQHREQCVQKCPKDSARAYFPFLRCLLTVSVASRNDS